MILCRKARIEYGVGFVVGAKVRGNNICYLFSTGNSLAH